jgi:hypothetical protein
LAKGIAKENTADTAVKIYEDGASLVPGG